MCSWHSNQGSMAEFGFIFPGQGSQQPGMLSSLATAFPLVQETFAEASEVLGLDLWATARGDNGNELNQTAITQPVLLAAATAIVRLWHQQGGAAPAMLAGHSLGEYSALVYAGSLSFADAVAVVHQRGKLMQAAVAEGTGKMAAVVGLDQQRITRICQTAQSTGTVAAANFNAPGQTVIAGEAAAVEQAITLCQQAGARRVLPLKVSVPSHCDLMRPAAEQLAEVLCTIEILPPRLPVVQNVDAGVSTEPDIIRDNLLRQLYSPVLWVDCVKTIADAGINHLLECGPGKVLAGLVKRIAPDSICYGSEDPESLHQAVERSLESTSG